MRSYGQYCSTAKALDVLGERWTLLIVRELLARGACRYTDLRAGLPGIATNLLADRLRELEPAGVVEREDAPPPVATTLFSLTARGRALEPVIAELGRWGVPLMHDSSPDDQFRGQWLRGPVRMFSPIGTRSGPLRRSKFVPGTKLWSSMPRGMVSMRLGADPPPTRWSPPRLRRSLP